METREVILKLRTQKGLSQDELAEKVFVTRQAVSRWENGDTVPNTETLKLLSKLFDVSINTLLGSPRTLICQCCGMPLDDSSISKEPSGEFNEEYGATRMENSHTQALRAWWIFFRRICRTKAFLPKRREHILMKCSQSSIIGNNYNHA